MKHTLSALAFSGLFALGISAMAPSAQASALAAGTMPVKAVQTVDRTAEGNLVEVRHRDRRWHHRHYPRRYHRPRSGFYFEFGTGGYRPPYYSRPYYVRPQYVRPRYGAPRAARGLPAAHVNWCYARYRSYRAYDNSFQPYNGSRRACISPYWR